MIDLTGERVFGSLNGMRVLDESAIDPLWQRMKSRAGAEVERFEPISFPVKLLK